MSNDSDQNMLELAARLRDQYRDLSKVVERKVECGDHSIEEISELIEQIRDTENHLRPLREDFRDGQRVASDELREVTDETISLMQSIMPKLGELEKATLESAKRLYPEIQQSVRVVQMQKAYGASS